MEKAPPRAAPVAISTSSTSTTNTAVMNHGKRQQAPEGGISRRGRLFMGVLALQFGLQPVLQKTCVDKHTVDRVSLIIVTELTKIFLCVLVILSSGPTLYRPMLESWTLRGSLAMAALPAAGYALQNWLSQLAYMNLDSLTFNLLNQTKTLFAALCLYLVMGKKQSRQQLVALSLLLAAALLLNSSNSGSGGGGGGGSATSSSKREMLTPEAAETDAAAAAAAAISTRLWLGVLPVMAAALLSGLMAAVTQRTLQRSGRDPSQLSLELAVYGVLTLLLTLGCGLGGSDTAATTTSGQDWQQGFFRGWTAWTWLPVLSQAAGGLIVGQQVTKHAGSVQKGFALIGGILVTAVVQSSLERSALTPAHWTAAVLVAGGTYLHSNYPHRSPKEAEKML
ncbi:unnamed protein product [Pylaiella littoralis]